MLGGESSSCCAHSTTHGFMHSPPSSLSWLILAIVAVWTAEALNTAFELLADVASSGFHPLVEKSKDVAAGAVLISAIGSAVIGVIVLGPHVLTVLKGIGSN